MRTRIEFREPVRIYSAVELSAMPLTVMQKCLAAQESVGGREATIGVEAWDILCQLRAGLELTWERPKKRIIYYIHDERIDRITALRQLEARGYFVLPSMVAT